MSCEKKIFKCPKCPYSCKVYIDNIFAYEKASYKNCSDDHLLFSDIYVCDTCSIVIACTQCKFGTTIEEKRHGIHRFHRERELRTHISCNCCNRHVCPINLELMPDEELNLYDRFIWVGNTHNPRIYKFLICKVCREWVPNWQRRPKSHTLIIYKRKILLYTCWMLSKILKKYGMYDRRFISYLAMLIFKL